jgi:hypothetical protein
MEKLHSKRGGCLRVHWLSSSESKPKSHLLILKDPIKIAHTSPPRFETLLHAPKVASSSFMDPKPSKLNCS